MLDLKLLYLLYLTLYWILSVLLTWYPARLIGHVQETLNDPERALYLGLSNIIVCIMTLYTTLFYFPNLSFAELVMAIFGLFVGAKGFVHIFWPKKIADAIKAILQTKLEILRNSIIIIALLLLYLLTTI